MESTVSIIVACISLVASLLAAGLSTGLAPFIASYKQKHKARRESERLFQKYREKLLSSADNLQARLVDIFHADLLGYHGRSQYHNDTLYIYTSFALGQLLTWTHILQAQTDLLPFALETNGQLTKFVDILYLIQRVLLDTGVAQNEGSAFAIWRSNQIAIAEFMSESSDGSNAETMCVGFYSFTRRWQDDETKTDKYKKGQFKKNETKNDGFKENENKDDENKNDETKNEESKKDETKNEESKKDESKEEMSREDKFKDYDTLRYWFWPVTEGIKTLVDKGPDAPEGNRLRRLQHLLIDLIDVLDPPKTRPLHRTKRRCESACNCPCSKCQKDLSVSRPPAEVRWRPWNLCMEVDSPV